ncbi:hypothetical protein M3Y97_00519200 [Aphelenchoides bicaudatus]|nr:hypothetical protein M3Y97_00519200 [Aphelenchoides bicaudatus]
MSFKGDERQRMLAKAEKFIKKSKGIKEEDDEFDDIKPEIKEEVESESEDDTENEDGDVDVKEEFDDSEPSDDDISGDEDDFEMKEVDDSDKPKKTNLSFETSNESLKEYLSRFGEVALAIICKFPGTDQPTGNAFVHFKDRESADKCLEELEISGLFIDERIVEGHRAVPREEASKFEKKKKQGKDSRNLKFLRFSLIRLGTDSARGMSEEDADLRKRLSRTAKTKLKNLHMFVSTKRLAIHNLPFSYRDNDLYELCLNNATKNGKIRECRIMRKKSGKDDKGKLVLGKSKGFGFVEFTEHLDALTCLRNLNNNPDVFTDKKRPIVEFSIEDMKALKIQEKRRQQATTKNDGPHQFNQSRNAQNSNSFNNKSKRSEELSIQRTKRLVDQLKPMPKKLGAKVRHKDANKKRTSGVRLEKFKGQHFPADADPFFFNEITERFMHADPFFEMQTLLEFVNENSHLKQPTILWCVVLAVLKRMEDKRQVVDLFNVEWRRWVKLIPDCSCMQKLFYELATQLVEANLLGKDIVEEISISAVSEVLSDYTNVDMRRCLSKFLAAVLNTHDTLDEEVAKKLLSGFHQTDHAMVLDAVSHVFIGSKYLQRMTGAEKTAVYEHLKKLDRPGLAFLQFAAQVYRTEPEKIGSRLDEQFETEKIPALVAFEILKLDDQNIPKEMLLKFIASHTSETVDNLVDCIEDYEEAFPQESERIRLEIVAAIPNVRHCSAQSLGKFMNHLRLNEGVISKIFIQAFVAAKTRIQREPDLLDVFLVDADDMSELMKETTVQRIFHELTVDIIMAERSFNWVHSDSAIGILDKIADYFHYDEDVVHGKISKCIDDNDDELGYVSLTASKFLFNHAPEYVLNNSDDLFVLNPNSSLRLAILNRLLLSSDSELPRKSKLQRILDDVVQLESNEQIQEKALNLAEKLLAKDGSYQSRFDELQKLNQMNEQRRQRSKSSDIDELAEIIQSAKINADCYTAEVSKECY